MDSMEADNKIVEAQERALDSATRHELAKGEFLRESFKLRGSNSLAKRVADVLVSAKIIEGGMPAGVIQAGRGGKPESSPPRVSHSDLYAIVKRRIARAVEACELEVDKEIGRVKRSLDKESRDKRIIAWGNERADFIAYVEECSVSLVRKVRDANGLVPWSGEPKGED